MLKHLTKLCILCALTAGLVACGDDTEEAANNDNNDNNDNNSQTTPDPNNTTPDPNNTTPDPNNTTPTTPTTPPVTLAPPVTCDSTPRPERCDAPQDTFDEWAPASVISSLRIVGAMGDEDCCFDFTGDGQVDNILGETLGGLNQLTSINDSVAGSINDGSIAVVLEHQGLSDSSNEFSINFLLGEQSGAFTTPNADGGNAYLINPLSFDEGVWPNARIATATLADGMVTTEAGVVGLSIELFGAALNLRISGALIEADVDATRTNLTDGTGVALVEGKLGGFVRLVDLYDTVNNFYAANCGCITGGDGTKLIDYDMSSADTASCVKELDSSACDKNDSVQDACVTIQGQCSLVTTVAGLTDVDSTKYGQQCVDDLTGESTCDSISLGARFEAAGANIEGVAAAQ